MKYLLLLAAVASTNLVFSQKAPLKFGDIPMEALQMTSYAPDSSAEAVILMDYGVSSIEYNQTEGFQLNFTRIRRIKVLTEAGKRWADFTISLYKDDDQAEKVSQFKAVTVNLENGKAIESKLSNDGIFKEKYSKNIDHVKVTLPNVKVGSVLDITYKVTSDFLVNFQDWDFQTTIPVVWSEYRAGIPEYYNYDKYMQGYLQVTINEADRSLGSILLTSTSRSGPGGSTQSVTQSEKIEYSILNYRWVIKDVPAFKDEPYLTTRNDFISRMNFELASIKMPGEAYRPILGTWEQINKRFAESPDFLGEVKGNGFLKKTVDELTTSATSPSEKVVAIHAYVKRSVAWDENYGVVPDKSFKSLLDDKKGNSAAINLLLASMLEKADFDVRPVLLSTRDHGFVREMTPAASQFNTVACLVMLEGKQVLLDATDQYLPAGYLPDEYLNGRGMVVSKDKFEWIALKAPSKTRSVFNSDFELTSEGVLKGQMKLEHVGYEAAEQRQKYFSEGDAEYVKSLVGSRPWELTSSEFTNTTDLSASFKQSHSAVINDHITIAGDVMYVNPFIEGQWVTNPFKSENRQYPVDFGNAFDEVYMVKIKLPEGYAVDEMPQPKLSMMPAGGAKYIFSSAISGDVINITSSLSFNKGMYSAEEYPLLREFCNQVVAKQAEQIVIKKK